MNNQNTKNRTLNAIAITGLFLAAFLINSGFKTQSLAIDGAWTKNVPQCEVGPGISINSIPTEVVIRKDKGGLQVTRTQKFGSGKILKYTENLKSDGSNSETIIDENTKRISKIQYAPDGSFITETSTYTDAQGKSTRNKTEIMTVLNGGKTLQVKTNENGEYSWTGVFDKSN